VDYQALKAKHRIERDHQSPDLALRLHRGLSWLNRAEQLKDDPDGQFIYLWIAFNAAYACDVEDRFRTSERAAFRDFLEKLIGLDTLGIIRRIVWSEFQKSIRALLENRYVFQGFWDYQNGRLSEQSWSAQFKTANKAAAEALRKRDTATILSVALSRIYTLRNQIVHGGATWNGSVNRAQVQDCGRLMGKLVPAVIAIMMSHRDVEWGKACYPVVT